MKKSNNLTPVLIGCFILLLAIIGCPTEPELPQGEDETADTTPPTVTAVNPIDGATDIDLGVWPSITFSEELSAGTISNQSIQVLSGSEQFDVTLHFGDTNPKTVDIQPNTPWERNTEYTIRVSTDIQDAAGNRLSGDYTSTFQTIAAPPNSNDYGYTGSDAGTLTGIFDFSNMTEETYNRVDTIRFGFGQGLDNLHIFTFYKDNFEESGGVHPFEVLNVQPLDFTEGYLSVLETGVTSDMYRMVKQDFPDYGSIPESIDFDLTDGDFTLDPIVLYDINDGQHTGADAVIITGSFDMSDVSVFDDYDAIDIRSIGAHQVLSLDPYRSTKIVPFFFYNIDPADVDGTLASGLTLMRLDLPPFFVEGIYSAPFYAPTQIFDFGIIPVNDADPVISTPANGTILSGVGINESVTLTFSEKMLGYNAGNGTIVLNDGMDPQNFFYLLYNTTIDSPTDNPGDGKAFFYYGVDIVPTSGWEYDTTYTVHTPLFRDLSGTYVDRDNYSFTFTTGANPLQTLTGSSLSSGTYQDSTGNITYVFNSDGSCTRTAGGQDYTGTWEYSGNDFLISTGYDAGGGITVTMDETYNAGYSLDGGANFYPYGYERTAGSGDTIVGTWEFAYRIDTTTDDGSTQTTTYFDMTATNTYASDGTWESSVVTKTDTNPTGTTETDSGTWDESDLSAGDYQLVDFGGRTFLHLADMPAYTRQ